MVGVAFTHRANGHMRMSLSDWFGYAGGPAMPAVAGWVYIYASKVSVVPSFAVGYGSDVYYWH